MPDNSWKKKVVSLDEAAGVVKSGDYVMLHGAASEPVTLTHALSARAPELEGVRVFHQIIMDEARYLKPGLEGAIRFNSTFVSGPARKMVEDGRADFMPCHYSEVPRLFRDRHWPVDVFFAQVTPPDAEGWCSVGLTADFSATAADCARVVVAQMNARLPRTNGVRLHVDQLDYIVLEDSEIPELPLPRVGEVERAIAEHVAGLIPDGATLQLGIGAIPDTVLTFLRDKNDLGIHSEMFSDGVVELAEAGNINNRRKTLNPGKFIATFLMGTRRLYDFVHENPQVEMHPVTYVNDPYIIGQHDNMVSINSALQIDLTGQINAESMGSRQFSGIGGQLDFVLGASRSRGGKSIFAFPSTAGGGKHSRICATLPLGSAVTTPRGNVHYVVTEYGAVNLRGKSIMERMEALISIAHPDFRDELRAQAARAGLPRSPDGAGASW